MQVNLFLDIGTLVVGDVNPTAACAMVGAKLWIPVIHLEAGVP